MVYYEDEFRRRVVEAYFNGEGTYSTLAHRFSIPAPSTVCKWIKIVRQLGWEGLMIRKSKQVYSSQFKQDVIHYYLTSGDSYFDVALRHGLTSGELLQRWHKSFLQKGIRGLSPKPKGRPAMTKKKQRIKKPMTREQELARENELLRAELAFIKKLHALGMNTPDRLKNEKHESSTNSERSSD